MALKTKPKRATSIRISEEHAQELNVLAREDGRGLTNYIVNVVIPDFLRRKAQGRRSPRRR